MSTALEKNDTAILSRALGSGNLELSPEAARFILTIELSTADQTELKRLSELAKEGTLSSEEDADLENYLHAGRVLELFKSKARIALKQTPESPNGPRA
ncbi:MAG TPA: hypothetical protein VLA12_21130 [Planctomycetaceae bacterium]|nr:hypothetical protein [Planctomycetaceae bacterium]